MPPSQLRLSSAGTLLSVLMTIGMTALLPACSTQQASAAPDHQDGIDDARTKPAATGLTGMTLPWRAAPKAETLSATSPPLLLTSLQVRQLPLVNLLQALNQQEGLSFDIDECGAVPVSVSQQGVELTELLDRLADMARIRWRLQGSRLSVRCDQPFTRVYAVDYPALDRSGVFTGTSGLPGQGSLGNGIASGIAGGQQAGGQQQTSSKHQNRFWESLASTVEQWLAAADDLAEPTRITETELNRSDQGLMSAPGDRRGRGTARDAQTPALLPGGGESSVSRTVTTRTDQRRPQVTAHPESGLLHVRATARQHRQLARLLALSRLRSQRQVEIQASLLEVRLSRQYERGIQWSSRRLSLAPAIALTGPSPGLIFSRSAAGEDGTGLAIRFLEQFGAVNVVSSPRVVALHQQAALIRMVENRIYFTVSAQAVPAGPNSAAFSTFNTQAHSLPVGFIMSVLPSIDDLQGVTLALRPSLSRIIGFVSDPNPGLASAGINSRIPEIQIREIESVLRLQDGQVAVLGGFIQSESRNASGGIPGAATSVAGRWLGTGESEEDSVSELVVLIRTRVTPAQGVL